MKTEYSAISSGTELRVYRGDVPVDQPADPTIAALSDRFGYPMTYGYSAVGRVVATGEGIEPAWNGLRVFSFNPHENYFLVSPDELLRLPEDIDPLQALFIPNMETAVNLVMDAAPLIGETVVVFGQGVPGLLTTFLLSGLRPDRLVAVDPIPLRREKAMEMGADATLDPCTESFDKDLEKEFSGRTQDSRADLVFELSSSADGLSQAILAAGYAGRVVIGSWYGIRPVSIDLSTRFHRNRLRLISSQVSTVDPVHSARWTKQRRMETVLKMVRHIRPEQWITHRFGIQDAGDAFRLLDLHPESAIQVIIVYE